MTKETLTYNACAQMVEAAGKACQPVIQSPVIQPNPNWDAMAVSFASLANALSWGSIVLAVIGLLGAVAWGKIVTDRASSEARDLARKLVDDYISTWLAEEAPQLIRRQIDLITDATLGSGDDMVAADQIGREA
ncbi:hypothetical protein PbB2_02439 [Candidatus Phycosocius bacilliformis]|uniref:Uncharacterized protein n=1 Tax=Candidatus Phycosocius bacilliformis TaxID=1445552 RepID=A0A2P2ECI1_9PROT|nr:hypothetical protein [Candidatus Phycosocius bacilliformis]GBF58751.1 hypothetical protein PbB2_02439 [Candidatus Phycosocius bacilliformis]